MNINEQYDFDWSDAYEEAFYGTACGCAWTWDAL